MNKKEREFILFFCYESIDKYENSIKHIEEYIDRTGSKDKFHSRQIKAWINKIVFIGKLVEKIKDL